MRKFNLSVSGLSTTLAMGLALWEVYFFFLAGNTGKLAARSGSSRPTAWASTWRGWCSSISPIS